jgi:leader peptidase (prepilin peptidase)/N-methyltransferase
MTLTLASEGEEQILILDGERIPLPELLFRQSDQVEAWCSWLEIGGTRRSGGKLVLGRERMCFENQEWPLAPQDEALSFQAEVSRLIIPREAMGFGDVKFLACIGSFLGWKGVLFSLFAGSVSGALVGAFTMLATGGKKGSRIPFGPYLALGAVIWLTAGPELTRLYADWISPAGERGGFFLLLHPSAL